MGMVSKSRHGQAKFSGMNTTNPPSQNPGSAPAKILLSVIVYLMEGTWTCAAICYTSCDIFCYTILSGQLKQHVEVAQEPVPIIDSSINNTDLSNNPTFNSLANVDADPFFNRPAIRNDITTNPQTLNPTGILREFPGFSFNYINFLNNHDEFCELWIAKCPLVGSCIYHLIQLVTFI